MLDTTDCTTDNPCERGWDDGEVIYCPWHHRDIFCGDPIEDIRRTADQHRFMVEMKINSIFATMRGSLGLPSHPDSTPMEATFAKFRKMGAIK